MYRRPFIPDPSLSQPSYQHSGYVPFPPAQLPSQIDDLPLDYKKRRFDEVAPPFSYGDRSIQQPRQGQDPHYLDLRWSDSSGNGSVKNYQTFSWDMNPAIEGYSRLYVDSCFFTMLYTETKILKLGLQLDPIVTPTQISRAQAPVNPTFMIPNQVVASQGQTLPSASNQNYFAYITETMMSPISVNVKGQTFTRFTAHLSDQNFSALTDGTMTNYEFTLGLRFE